SGLVNFDDLDANDLVDITFASNDDIARSGADDTDPRQGSRGARFPTPATSGAAAPGSVAWQYSADSIDLDFLAAGETITFSYTRSEERRVGKACRSRGTSSHTGNNDARLVSAEASAHITQRPGDSNEQ